jgi:hypothetical protein
VLVPNRVENPVYVSCVHPQTIGQAHHMLWYERLIEYIASKDGVWFATCDQIADAWVDDEEDRALMAQPDVHGVEAPPPDSGWASPRPSEHWRPAHREPGARQGVPAMPSGRRPPAEHPAEEAPHDRRR